jgi:hypothetical protein
MLPSATTEHFNPHPIVVLPIVAVVKSPLLTLLYLWEEEELWRDDMPYEMLQSRMPKRMKKLESTHAATHDNDEVIIMETSNFPR